MHVEKNIIQFQLRRLLGTTPCTFVKYGITTDISGNNMTNMKQYEILMLLPF